ncbi:hypothetical protein GN958_ATG17350 [Phytophthora infestans]|uniref:Uncharacterized protein n=2 Tax=Phytophthora infestans TaxID=4787 RepID=A0A8S9TXG4_PHYIN|nr:hypothetical protein GN958_ATG17350 [Phytophthora infestans]
MMMKRSRSGTWRARQSPRTETSGSVRQRMALEDVQMKTVALKCSACLRIMGDPVRQVLRGGLGRSKTNLRRGEQVALLSEEQREPARKRASRSTQRRASGSTRWGVNNFLGTE